MIYQCWKGIQNLWIYEMTPIGLLLQHLCDGTHYSCIQTLMNKLQKHALSLAAYVCWSLDKHAAIMMGIMKNIKDKFLGCICVLSSLELSHQLIVVWSNDWCSDQHPWAQPIRLKLLTCSPDECMHYTSAPSDLKINLRRTLHHWTNLVKRFTRGLGMSHHFLRMPWQTAQKS